MALLRRGARLDDDGAFFWLSAHVLEGERVVAVVGALLGDEHIVTALLHDAAVLQHDDAVGVADGREAVGDDDRGAARA